MGVAFSDVGETDEMLKQADFALRKENKLYLTARWVEKMGRKPLLIKTFLLCNLADSICNAIFSKRYELI